MSCPGEESDPEDVPPLSDGDALPIPESMSHLHNRRLVQEVLEYLSSPQFQVRDGASVAFGGVVHELPYDPSQPTSCAYVLFDLPTPDLGSIPRDEIFEELRAEPAREAKQRRDFGFPDGRTVPLLQHANTAVEFVGLVALLWGRPQVFKDEKLQPLCFTLAGSEMFQSHIKQLDRQEDVRKSLGQTLCGCLPTLPKDFCHEDALQQALLVMPIFLSHAGPICNNAAKRRPARAGYAYCLPERKHEIQRPHHPGQLGFALLRDAESSVERVQESWWHGRLPD